MTGPPVKIYYGRPMLPDVTRVLACLYEKEIEFKLIDLHGGRPVSLDFLKLQGSAPVHVLGFEDGSTNLFDSRSICRYISEKYADQGNKNLLGRDFLERASIEQWLRSEEQSFEPPSWNLIFHLAFAPLAGLPPPEPGLIEKNQRKLADVLDIYNQRLGETKFLAGNEFTLVDLNHLPNSYYLANSGEFGHLFDLRTNVSRWWRRISSRSSWRKVVEILNEVNVEKVEDDQKAKMTEKKKKKTLTSSEKFEQPINPSISQPASSGTNVSGKLQVFSPRPQKSTQTTEKLQTPLPSSTTHPTSQGKSFPAIQKSTLRPPPSVTNSYSNGTSLNPQEESDQGTQKSTPQTPLSLTNTSEKSKGSSPLPAGQPSQTPEGESNTRTQKSTSQTPPSVEKSQAPLSPQAAIQTSPTPQRESDQGTQKSTPKTPPTLSSTSEKLKEETNNGTQKSTSQAPQSVEKSQAPPPQTAAIQSSSTSKEESDHGFQKSTPTPQGESDTGTQKSTSQTMPSSRTGSETPLLSTPAESLKRATESTQTSESEKTEIYGQLTNLPSKSSPGSKKTEKEFESSSPQPAKTSFSSSRTGSNGESDSKNVQPNTEPIPKQANQAKSQMNLENSATKADPKANSGRSSQITESPSPKPNLMEGEIQRAKGIQQTPLQEPRTDETQKSQENGNLNNTTP